MMVSNKGSSLDMQKQLIHLLLGQKATKGIKSSDSTLFEKLTLDKKSMVTEEERAIFNLLMMMKKDKTESAADIKHNHRSLRETKDDDGVRSATSIETFKDSDEDEHSGDENSPGSQKQAKSRLPEFLGNLLRMPFRMRRPTLFDKMTGNGEEEILR